MVVITIFPLNPLSLSRRQKWMSMEAAVWFLCGEWWLWRRSCSRQQGFPRRYTRSEMPPGGRWPWIMARGPAASLSPLGTASVIYYSIIYQSKPCTLHILLISRYNEEKHFTGFHCTVFNYASSAHTVEEVRKSDYDACTTGNSITADSSGATTITLKTAGTHYFICGMAGHCGSGMKLAVTVAAAGSTVIAPPGGPAITTSPPLTGTNNNCTSTPMTGIPNTYNYPPYVWSLGTRVHCPLGRCLFIVPLVLVFVGASLWSKGTGQCSVVVFEIFHIWEITS